MSPSPRRARPPRVHLAPARPRRHPPHSPRGTESGGTREAPGGTGSKAGRLWACHRAPTFNFQVNMFPFSLRAPNSSIYYPKRGTAAPFAARLRMQPWYLRARDREHRHRSPTPRWRLPDPHRRDAKSPHWEQHPMAGPPQVPGEKRQGTEAPAQNAAYPERLEGISSSSDIGERKVVPCHAPMRGFVHICTLEGNSGAGEQSWCPAEDDGWDFHPAALPTDHEGCTLE